MKKTQIFSLLSLALILLSLTAAFIGCKKQGDFYISVEDPKKIIDDSPALQPSRIGEEILQYPGKTEEYKYNVFETYIEIEEYIGSDTDIIVPDTIEDLPVKVVGGFYLNDTIKTVTLPEGIVIISGYAFDNCQSLQAVNIPETVIEIGERAFNDCHALKSLTIPQSVTKIGNKAFAGSYEDRNLFVRFYKGSAAAEYVAENIWDIQYEIIDLT